MNRIPCFFYREGEHFTLPPALQGASPPLSFFAVCDETASIGPHPRFFRPVSRAEDAAVFMFPWSIGQYIDGGASDAIREVLENLPYYSGRELRHLVCDDGDFTVSLDIPLCLFKISVTRDILARCVPIPYTLSPHMTADMPIFDWQQIKYDTSFVGNDTNVVRKAIVASVQREMPALRVFVDFDDGFIINERYFFNTMAKRNHAKVTMRQALFRKSLKQSLTVLCPPGIGPHSIRMYETMYMGRIPVLFGDDPVYPLEHLVDYSAFTLHVPQGAIMDTGKILTQWLREHSREELHERCVLACRTWNAYFTSEKCIPALLEEARRKFGI